MIDTSSYTEGTQKYISAVEDFLSAQYGTIRKEWCGILENLAYQFNLFQLAEASVKEMGLIINTSKGLAQNPAVKISQDSSTQIQRICKELGLTPMAIGRLKNISDKDDKDDTDAFLENLMK